MSYQFSEQPRETLRPEEIEAAYGISIGHLQKLRVSGGGPPFYKPTHRLVLYRRIELEQWLNQSRRDSTSSSGGIVLGQDTRR